MATAAVRIRKPEVVAMSLSGAGAIASGLLSALATKIIAVLLGPAWVAVVATLQQVQEGALAGATLNGQTALVQGASAFTSRRRSEFLASALRLFTIATAAVSVGLIATPSMVARWAGLPSAQTHLVPWLAIPVALSSVFTFLTALLRARGKVGKLALIQMMAALAMALAAWPAALAVRAGHGNALVAMLGFSAAAGVCGSAWVLVRGRDEIAGWFDCGRFSASAARHFFTISASMLATSLLASAVLLAVRGQITRISGIAATGQFDAAWGISMGQVGLVLGAMRVYSLPVLARARDAEERCTHISKVLTMVIVAATPVIVLIALAKPVVLSLLYSGAFRPAGQYLRWTLVGDYLKVSSTVLAIPMLAAGDMRAFLTADCLTQAAFFGGTWLIGRVRAPGEAASIAFVISYAVNLMVCAVYARGRHGFRFGLRGGALFFGGFAVVAIACWVGR